ncbi:MAG: cobyric acid synthase [Methanomassiliicoccus sp.]|nr:cobyric acid synthase [Methanomassiliicoccus sp.]
MGRIMVMGTSSGAGKTTIAALLCRHFTLQGLKVAPFKASNLSLNSFVTSRGEEIGVSQAYQAWACGREPEGEMNPILLKPKGSGVCQIVLDGHPYMDVGRGGRTVERENLMGAVTAAYRKLVERNDVVVIEGSGSPAEINLRREDIANMATAEMAQAPVVLVGDIERGGVFAALHGTYTLLEPRHRQLVKAYLINRFRGDASILGAGIDRLSELTGLPCLGVMPFADLRFPSEDSLDLAREQGKGMNGADVRQGWLDNLDSLYRTSRDHIDYEMIDRIALS